MALALKNLAARERTFCPATRNVDWPLGGLCWSPSGAQAACVQPNGIVIFDTKSAKVIHQLRAGARRDITIVALSWSPVHVGQPNYLAASAVNHFTQFLFVWDVDSGELVADHAVCSGSNLEYSNKLLWAPHHSTIAVFSGCALRFCDLVEKPGCPGSKEVREHKYCQLGLDLCRKMQFLPIASDDARWNQEWQVPPFVHRSYGDERQLVFRYILRSDTSWSDIRFQRAVNGAYPIHTLSCLPDGTRVATGSSTCGLVTLWGLTIERGGTAEFTVLHEVAMPFGLQRLLYVSFPLTATLSYCSDENTTTVHIVKLKDSDLQVKTLTEFTVPYALGESDWSICRDLHFSAQVGLTYKSWYLGVWSDRTHRMFGAPFKKCVFRLMCIRYYYGDGPGKTFPCAYFLPMEMWLEIFHLLSLCF